MPFNAMNFKFSNEQLMSYVVNCLRCLSGRTQVALFSFLFVPNRLPICDILSTLMRRTATAEIFADVRVLYVQKASTRVLTHVTI